MPRTSSAFYSGFFSNKEVEWEESIGVTQHLWDQHVERLIRDCREA